MEEMIQMSDNNQATQLNQSAQAPAQKAAAPAQEPKTFTQRFQEMEQALQQSTFVVNFHNNVIQQLLQELQKTKADLTAAKEAISAMLHLGNEGKQINLANTVEKITFLQAESHKNTLATEVREGRLKEVEAVSGENCIVSFSSDDIVFGYNLVAAFKEEEVKSKIVGAKVGDKVGAYTVLGIYEEVVPQSGATDGQQAQPAAQQ
jgi:hypothetical protein